jgi:hypothetical protein
MRGVCCAWLDCAEPAAGGGGGGGGDGGRPTRCAAEGRHAAVAAGEVLEKIGTKVFAVYYFRAWYNLYRPSSLNKPNASELVVDKSASNTTSNEYKSGDSSRNRNQQAAAINRKPIP